jgi:hypothetical protein
MDRIWGCRGTVDGTLFVMHVPIIEQIDHSCHWHGCLMLLVLEPDFVSPERWKYNSAIFSSTQQSKHDKDKPDYAVEECMTCIRCQAINQNLGTVCALRLTVISFVQSSTPCQECIATIMNYPGETIQTTIGNTITIRMLGR